jgi:hypothetical protein
LRGKAAHLVVKDRSRRSYLLVDEIVEWRAP